jgi:small-conductance mechanosensitive channel
MIFFLCNVLAFILNVFGHVAIAKLLSNSSILQLVLAVSLSHLSEILTEAIYIQLERSKDSVYAAYLEYDNIRKKFKSFLNMGAILIWIMGFLWSLSFLDTMQQYFFQFLESKISLGNISFTPSAVLIFSITIWISVLVSNIISIVFGSSEQQFASTKKNKVGSWMMLVRLAVITCGFFIAIAAAGIPVDKLAIVFGALSVGIGFGLQNVVGNLVSGIILAFEKPMQVGDVIEIGNQNGTVKQIGIRSSKITTFDGAEIIVPNGDFISQKLTNWTHTNQFRRIEVIVGVAYGSPIEKVTQLILDVVIKQENVMTFPKPVALVHEFADSSVNFRVLFWTREYETWTILKSSALTAIYNSFAENGITIPFPQRDLYLKELPKKDE